MIILNKKSFYFYTSLILIYSLTVFFKPDYIHKYFFYIFFYNIFLDLGFKFLNKNAFQKKNHTVIIVILSTFLRFVLSIVFVFLFGLIATENFMLFTINFLIVFLLFILFEITILLFNLHRE